MVLNATAIYMFVFDPFPAEVYIPPDPKDYLAEKCQAPDCDYDLLNSIITCESQWRMVKNSQSSAYGYFQIIDSTERTTPQYQSGQTKFDPYANIDMGIYLYDRHGASPWYSSQACWQPKYYRAINSP